MSEAGRRRWWRAAAVAVMTGGAVAGVWLGVARDAGAEPIPKAAPVAGVPETPPLPVIPPITASPVVPASAGEPGKLTVPPLPPAGLPPLPVPPAIPPLKSDSPDTMPPQVPPMMGGILPIKPADKKDETPQEIPAPRSVSPKPIEIAPPPPAVKTPDPVKPPLSVPPVSGLPGGIPGASVKSDTSGGGSGVIPPALPEVPPPISLGDPGKPATVPTVPAVGGPGGASGTTVDLAKPPTFPVQKDTIPFSPPPIHTTVPTSGETTMIHLNKAAALAVIGGALMAPNPVKAAPIVPVPAPIVPTAQTGGNDEKIEVAELKKQVEDANKKLTDIQKDLKTLTELLNGKKDEKGYLLPSDPGVVAQMKRLSDKLNDVEKELEKLKTQTSLRPATPPAGAVDPKAGKGTVRIVNEYPVRISIVVNGTSYRVEPSKSLDIDVPMGEFSYQLLESGAASTKSAIKEKETVTLRIK